MLVLEQAGIGITGIWLEVQNGQCVTKVARIGAGFGGLPSAAWMLRRGGRYARQKGVPRLAYFRGTTKLLNGTKIPPLHFSDTTKLLNGTEIPALHFGDTTKLLNGTRMPRYFLWNIFGL